LDNLGNSKTVRVKSWDLSCWENFCFPVLINECDYSSTSFLRWEDGRLQFASVVCGTKFCLFPLYFNVKKQSGGKSGEFCSVLEVASLFCSGQPSMCEQ